MGDDSPVQESADSWQRLCNAVPNHRAKGCSARVSLMALSAAPCCPWEDFPMQRYEAAVGWPRYSLPTG